MAHTPGPWTATRYRREPGEKPHWTGWHVKQEGSGVTDVAYVDDVDYGPQVAKANARLIAAAPELLAACEAAFEALGSSSTGLVLAARRQVAEAIALTKEGT